MAGLDIKALEKAQQDLEKRTSGSKNWIQLSKIDGSIDVRIMDPLPSMNGIYYVEVPVWWIDSVRVISPKLFGPAERDTIKDVIDEAKKANDPDIIKLLNAKGDKGLGKIQYKPEFWVPVLKFNWEFDGNGGIKGIYDKDGGFDTNLIKNFIEDGKWKIASMGIMALKAINEIATKRLGGLMTDPVKGFNIVLTKAGKDRETKYTAVKMDSVPMPAEFYTPELMIDPFEIAQSLMFTDDYMDKVIGKYLYGEDCPEKTDSDYAYPELREKFKSKFSEEATEEVPQKTARQRPGRAVSGKPTPPPVQEQAPASTPVTTTTRGGRPPRGGGPPRGGRPGRNVAADLKDV